MKLIHHSSPHNIILGHNNYTLSFMNFPPFPYIATTTNILHKINPFFSKSYYDHTASTIYTRPTIQHPYFNNFFMSFIPLYTLQHVQSSIIHKKRIESYLFHLIPPSARIVFLRKRTPCLLQ